MNNMRVSSMRLLLVTGLLLWPLSEISATVLTTPEISRLFAENKHDEVVKRLNEVSWGLASDPFLVTALCSSRLELKNSPTSCIDASRAAPGIVTFSSGLTNLWSGNSRTAVSAFQKLAQDPDTALWGYLGLFEHSEYTGNFTELGKLIERFHKKYPTAPELFKKRIYHYEAVFLQETGKWEKLKSFLSQFNRQQIVSTPDLLAANFRMLYVQANLAEAKKLLDDAQKEIGSSEEFQRLNAEYLWLTAGKQASDDFLRMSILSRPDYAALRIELAYLRLQTNEQKKSEAVKELEQLASTHAHYNIALAFDIALGLANYQQIEGSSRILKTLTHRVEAPEDFTAFQSLEAWNAVYGGRLGTAKNYVKTAIAMSPNDQSANWLRFLIAKKEGQWSEALEALIRIFTMDPYNENVVVSLLDLGEQTGMQSKMKIILMGIKSRHKWYSPEVQKKIKSTTQ